MRLFYICYKKSETVSHQWCSLRSLYVFYFSFVSRPHVGHTLKYSIKKYDVILLLDGILRGVSTKGIIIRNDNGSQFLAHNIRKYLTQNDIIQEFTHIVTLEKNSCRLTPVRIFRFFVKSSFGCDVASCVYLSSS